MTTKNMTFTKPRNLKCPAANKADRISRKRKRSATRDSVRQSTTWNIFSKKIERRQELTDYHQEGSDSKSSIPAQEHDVVSCCEEVLFLERKLGELTRTERNRAAARRRDELLLLEKTLGQITFANDSYRRKKKRGNKTPNKRKRKVEKKRKKCVDFVIPLISVKMHAAVASRPTDYRLSAAEKRVELKKKERDRKGKSFELVEQLDLIQFRNTTEGYHFKPSKPEEEAEPVRKLQGEEAKKSDRKEKGSCPCRTARPAGIQESRFRVRSNCPFCCSLCEFWSRSGEKVKKHKNETHRFRCDQCQEAFKSQEESDLHVYKVHEPKIVCVTCDGCVLKNYESYESHKRTRAHIACEKAEKRGAYYLKTRFNIHLPAVSTPSLNLSKVPEILRKRDDGQGLRFQYSDLVRNLDKAEGSAFVNVDVSQLLDTAGSAAAVTPSVLSGGQEAVSSTEHIPSSLVEKQAENCGLSAYTPLTEAYPTAKFAVGCMPNYSPKSRSVMEELVFGSSSLQVGGNDALTEEGAVPAGSSVVEDDTYRPNMDDFPRTAGTCGTDDFFGLASTEVAGPEQTELLRTPTWKESMDLDQWEFSPIRPVLNTDMSWSGFDELQSFTTM